MTRVAIDWLVLELTGSIAVVGLLVFVQWAPVLVFGQFGAVIADRLPRRATMVGSYLAIGVLWGVLAVVTLAGALQLWLVLVVTVLMGVVYMVEIPTRAVFFAKMVPQRDLPNAISLYQVVFWVGGVVGPVLSGILIAMDAAGWTIAFFAVSSVAVAATIALMRPAQLIVVPTPPAAARGQIREAIRYARSKPTIFWPMVLATFTAVFAMPISVLLAGMAQKVFESGASGFGLYSSLLAGGAAAGAVLSTGIRSLQLRFIVLLAAGFGLALCVTSVVPSALLFCVVLVVAGCLRLVWEVSSDSLVQLSSNLVIRSRIVSLYVAIIVGGQAIGSPLVGAIADAFGTRTALLVAGLVPLIAALAIAAHLFRTGTMRIQFRLKRGQSIISLVAKDHVEREL